MNNKNIKMMFLLFSLLIILFGTVSAADTTDEYDTSTSPDTIQDIDSSDNVVPNDKIPEKNEKIINDKTSTKKSNRIPTKITIDPIETTQYTDNVTISGKYRDITGRILRYTPLNVKINTNSYRIQTDVNGNFAIKIVNPEHNIRVSYVSCKEFLTKISNMPKKVKLQPTDLIQIVDVNARKRDVAGGEPLLVVDGVIMQGVEHLDVNEPTSIDVLMLKEFGIKQSDIESVTVLKDGAATAIYGEKGKNGVIEIKTRVKQDTIVARVMNNENGLAIKSNNDDLPLDSMLNRLPGLEKQPDGSFTVNGKKVKRVLVNGEEMNLEDLVK